MRTAAGVAVLTALVVVFGSALTVIPITVLQLVIGLLLLLFGVSWLRKAVLRAAGMMPLHDETDVFARATAAMREQGVAPIRRWDTVAIATTFKAVVLEGLEIVFIVLAVGAAGHMIIPASLGAAVAGLAVVVTGLLLHRPLARVPENTLKLTVGILVASFGVFWVGEGVRFHWPGDDFAIMGLAIAFLVVSLLLISTLRRLNGRISRLQHPTP